MPRMPREARDLIAEAAFDLRATGMTFDAIATSLALPNRQAARLLVKHHEGVRAERHVRQLIQDGVEVRHIDTVGLTVAAVGRLRREFGQEAFPFVPVRQPDGEQVEMAGEVVSGIGEEE